MNFSKAIPLVAAMLGIIFVPLPIPARAAGSRIPRIEIKPQPAFINDRVDIRLRGFEPNQHVMVRVGSTNNLGMIWESYAEFLTDRQGRVIVATQAPIAGTYQHADASGLFWSMRLLVDEKLIPASESAHEDHKPANFQVTADISGQTVATANLQRLFIAPGVERMPVRDGQLRGVFFAPAGKGPHPGVILLGGSEGGWLEMEASFLASKGYAVFALAYFNYADLPKSLENIPLEYFEAGIHWLKSRREVRSNEIAVIGASRGGELALLLGATFQQIKAVVAIAPSGIIWGGISTNETDFGVAAWTYHGQPLPFVGFQDLTPSQLDQFKSSLQSNDYSSARLFQMMLTHQAAVEKASIPVEKIYGPVLLISGNDDQIWPATKFAELVMAKLKQAKHPFADRHLAYEAVGHYIPLPNLPATVNSIHPNPQIEMALGGDPEHRAAAGADAWSQIVKFLKTTFPR